MDERTVLNSEAQEQENSNSINFQTIYTALVLNWKWFVLSVIICLGLGVIYLRYATPVYQSTAKLLIKDQDDSNGSRSSGTSALQNISNLGIISTSNGIDNELEIIASHTIAQEAVRDLKLYVNYYGKGRLKDRLLYKTQPINFDLDSAHLEKLPDAMTLQITRDGQFYHLTGKYYVQRNEVEIDGPFSINQIIKGLPATLPTKAGTLFISQNPDSFLVDGGTMKAVIVSPKTAAIDYVNRISVSQTSKTTTIAQLVFKDENPLRGMDYLNQLVICYNRQANEDKNEIATRTEAFINGRLEKINAELGNTESQLESYKKRNRMVELTIDSKQAVTSQDAAAQKLVDANTQVELMNSIMRYMQQPANHYQTLPSNVGLTDPSATALIAKYNETVLERNRMLRTASENSPSVTPLTSQLDELSRSIKRAMIQAKRNLEIQRSTIAGLYNRYQNDIANTPSQERILTQIGRQQEVKSGLYLMLLQKREENSISLAATVDKGKLIDAPAYAGQISPKRSIIMFVFFILGLAIPSVVLFLINFFKYKIEGHDDVEKLTSLPIIADVAVANDTAKNKADIVIKENQNNMMEEVFRSMRTNLQFMLKKDEKVIMFTSSSSGEGKTFTAANLAVSFALLNKKVILIGLDIRKPRLAELFQLHDREHGITNLLVQDNPSAEDIQSQIVASGVNNNLDLLMSGPIPPNPTELLSRNSLDMILQQLRTIYDYILIDTAPVGLVTDTLEIGRVANATVFLCRADFTPKESIAMINELAEEQKLPNISIVINGIDMSKKKNAFHYGYGRYGKYGHYGHYGHYGKYGHYGHYRSYGNYGSYGNYSNSHYGNQNDTSIKK